MHTIDMAIVRQPARSMLGGLSTANLGSPDYELAIQQHEKYVQVLKACDVEVMVLEALEDYPDSVFVEDTAVLTPECAIICRPGVASRQGEEEAIHTILQDIFGVLACIRSPGTLEGGDVLQVGKHFFVGLSRRSNEEGIEQFFSIIKRYGYSGSAVPLKSFLHLKTGVAYLGDRKLLLAGECLCVPAFKDFKRIEVPGSEAYCGNAIYVNGSVIMPCGFPQTEQKLRAEGFSIQTVDMSEFQKLDGGVSCLSLRL